MKTSGGYNDVNAGSQPEVIGVAEDDLGAELGFECFETNALDSAGSADRHKDRRLDPPATSGQHTRPCLALLRVNLKFYRGLRHVRKFSRKGAKKQRRASVIFSSLRLCVKTSCASQRS